MDTQLTSDFTLFPNQLEGYEYFTSPYTNPMMSEFEFNDTVMNNSWLSDPITTQSWSTSTDSVPSQDREWMSSRSPSISSPYSSPSTSSQHSSPSSTPAATQCSTTKPRFKRGRPRQPSKPKAHNEIEQKYRNTINASIQSLQRAVPQLAYSDESSLADRPPTKAAILKGATTYIKQLEQERDRLLEDNRMLRSKNWSGPLIGNMGQFGQQ